MSAVWPDHDPPPEVHNTDPLPADAPKRPSAVLDLAGLAIENDWMARSGYSRAVKRAQRIGSYIPIEIWGVWAAHTGNGWRFSAMYERNRGRGAWTWSSIAIWRIDGKLLGGDLGSRFVHATVTDLKEFVKVQGSVLPAWFKAIAAREAEKVERTREAARNRPRKRKEGTS